jgi:type II secretory pathway pseudopilin PulG
MKTKNENGFIIGTLLVVIMIVSVLLVVVTSTSVSNYQSATKEQFRVSAQFAADAGLDVGIHELNLDENWAGTLGEVDFYTSTSGRTYRTTYEVEITPGSSPLRKTITSTARSYSPSTATTPQATRIYQLEAEEVTSGFGPGSVVSGVGGLILENNAKITGGDVVVNGRVTVNNGAQIGLSTNPINLRVAHQSCPIPVNATYPQVCTTGQPITNNGLIFGNVQAQNQTTATGMSSPGLTSSLFAPIAVPGYDRPLHKAAVAVTHAPSDTEVSCGNNQTKTWPANARITGNFTLGNGCTVNIIGDVWITGNLSFGNNSTIRIADSMTTTRPVIMIDGSAGINTGNNTRILPNSSGTGAEVITTWWNTNTATNGGFNCGGIPDLLDCTNVTGLALSTSQATTTINLSNNASASNTVFRTLWSRANISNNGALGAVSGQTIQLGENAVINFTASIPGSDNLTKTWVKKGYLRVFQ